MIALPVSLQMPKEIALHSSPSADKARRNFSERLNQALANAGIEAGPSSLTAYFNRLSPMDAISVHAARKWLMGGAIPTQPRIVILADWLQVSPAWLRFGEAVAHGRKTSRELPASIDARFRLLHDAERVLVRALIDVILKARRPPD
jgi:hypothetical protein